MRRKIVAGNWKMNTSFEEALALTKEIITLKKSIDVELIINPPFPYILSLAQLAIDSTIQLGAQNCSEHDSGAYTGEVASSMIKSVGANYVILGHSERRSHYHETDVIISEKVKQALKVGLQPIFCCGEQLFEREQNQHFEVVKNQLLQGLFHLSEEEIQKIIIAYEPVWAIGTGVTATSEQAQEMHAFIRGLVEKNYTKTMAENCSILYGGSCNATNAKELFSKPDVDGGLIGGASLKAQDFIAIANSF